MADESSSWWCWVCGAVVAIGLLLMVILLPLSFSDVEYYEVMCMRIFERARRFTAVNT